MTSPTPGRQSQRPIFQPIRGRGIRKLLWKRLGIPRGVVHPMLSFAKRAVNPAQVRLRRDLAEELESSFDAIAPIPRTTGSLPFAAGSLPGSEAAVISCREIFASMDPARLEAGLFNPRKRFLLAVLSGDDFVPYPDLVAFMVSRPILDRVTRYLGCSAARGCSALVYTGQRHGTPQSVLPLRRRG